MKNVQIRGSIFVGGVGVVGNFNLDLGTLYCSRHGGIPSSREISYCPEIVA